jgi:hypothetical protein
MSFEQQVARIAAKLALAKLTAGRRLKARKVEAFERHHGVRLPEAYREFLIKLGNGGDGPYSMRRLAEWNEHRWDDDFTDLLSEPCLLEPQMQDREIFDRFEKAGTYLRRIINTHGGEYEQDLRGCGMVTVAHCGCDYYCTLVVAGPYAGRIVYLGGIPYFSEEPDFLSWYERWLDERAAGYDLEYFGWGPRGDEQALLDAHGRLPKPVFLRAITRCRRLSADGLKILWESLPSTEPEVRDLALNALSNLRVPAPPDRVPVLEAIRLSNPGRVERILNVGRCNARDG